MRIVKRRLLPAAVAALAAGLTAAPAQAVHIFPLTPAFDPLGHDCAKNLQPAPAAPERIVWTVGFSFIDTTSLSSNTSVTAGQTVSWQWLADHCHSVTFVDVRQPAGTQGAPGFAPAQPELVRHGTGSAFSVRFDQPGVYNYLCVHHAGVGMSGVVTVT